MRAFVILVCLISTAVPVAPARAADLPATQTTLDLVRAAAAGDLPRTTALLAAGADPNVVAPDWRSPLIHAARLGRFDLVQVLVRAGAVVDWQDADKVSALILAAWGNHPKIAEFLVRAGADPMLTDRWGRRALDYALARGKNDGIARMLRRAEVNRPLASGAGRDHAGEAVK
ncbi:MAG: ankyrin repeat domain-containing protein [Rhodospirillales bacterium]